jgi:predicted dehydrogenase
LTFRDEQLTLRRLKKDPEVLSTEGDGFEGIMKAFVEGLEQGHEFSPGFEDALLALTVAHAVQESSRTGKTIHLEGKP